VLIEPETGEPTDGDAASDGPDAACPAFATVGPDDPDPSIETFPVSVEQQHVVLYMGESRPARVPAAQAGPAGEA
jgi:hypothetical protein